MNKAIIFDWVGTLYKRNTDLFPEVKNVLRVARQRGYKLGLVSLAGQGIENRKRDIKETGIEKYFDFVTINLTKDESTFKKVMEKLKTNSENTLVIGDRMLREIKIGNSLGCKTCWIQKGDYADQKPDEETGKPTYIIKSLSKVLEII